MTIPDRGGLERVRLDVEVYLYMEESNLSD